MSNKILVLLIGVLMVLMLGLGGGLFMMWNKLSDLNAQSHANASEKAGGDGALEHPVGPISRSKTPTWKNSRYEQYKPLCCRKQTGRQTCFLRPAY